MVDYFALLNFPRTPWFEAAPVQARFLELSAAVHPDRVHSLGAAEIAEANAKFAELNKGAAVLRDAKERLHHLIALETGAAPVASQNIPSDLIDVFGKVGQACRKIDQFLAERAKATSPILQAQFFAQGLDWNDQVTELQQLVGALKVKAEAELQAIGTSWPDQKPFGRLGELAHVFAMVGRWEAQLQERFASLAAV